MVKIKIALLGSDEHKFSKVYTKSVLEKLGQYGEVSERINRSNIEKYSDFLSDCEVAFSTWGMIAFTEEEIRKYMPKLKFLFYSAGSFLSQLCCN